MTFLISEDEALRNLLLNMTVTDQKSNATGSPQRSVKVYFGQPDQELRDQTYPYITAAIRRFNNRQQEAERFLIKRAFHHAGASR